MPPFSQVNRNLFVKFIFLAGSFSEVFWLLTTITWIVGVVVLGIINEQYYRLNNVSQRDDGHIKYGWVFTIIIQI